jgi:rhodanese-related sulfurtransferase
MTTPTDLAFDLPPGEVAKLHGEGVIQLIDIREPYEREAGHIANSRHIELRDLSAEAPSIDPSVPVVFVCRVGGRSTMAAAAFARAGYDAHNLEGGMVAWAATGLALEPVGGHVADH